MTSAGRTGGRADPSLWWQPEGSGEARHHRGLPGGRTWVMRQPDADTNGRNGTCGPSWRRPGFCPRDGPGPRPRPVGGTAPPHRRRRPLAANELVDMSDVAAASAPAWRTATGTSASSSPTCRAWRSTTRSAPRPTPSTGSQSPTPAVGRQAPGKESRHERHPVRGLRTSAWSCAPPERWSPGPCTRAAPASGSGCPSKSLALVAVLATAAVRCRMGAKQWRGTRTGPAAAWRAHRAEGRECTGGV